MSLSRAFAAIPRAASPGSAPLLSRLAGQGVLPAAAEPAADQQRLPGAYPLSSLPVRIRCRIVRQITTEMVMLVEDRLTHRRDRRRASTHIRQIAMYLCHVVLQLSLTEIGAAFGRDRTTAGHACNVVEDRRDDPAFDDFVSAVERVVSAVFGAGAGGEDA
ncbi:helix-turn-helix domain-containing protein [Rhizobium sp. YIM 134829]|uniref:helix-turn-helix domain-containing protein n=1 Tax=Rhizobium sp. YIM 134829 TaxID=3390453 RepID=UPI00397CFD4A